MAVEIGELTQTHANLGKIAAWIGIIQGLVWSAMSLACIILYNLSLDLDITTATNYEEYISKLLYNYFLKDDSAILTYSFVIRPFDFNVFMWIYFILSFGWLALSTRLFIVIQFKKNHHYKFMVTLGSLTLIVSLIDLIFTSLLARDYSSCSNLGLTSVGSEIVCRTILGIGMSLAARGFTLWLVNVGFSIVLLIVGTKANVKVDPYSSVHIPRVQANIPKKNLTPVSSLRRQNEDNYVGDRFNNVLPRPGDTYFMGGRDLPSSRPNYPNYR